MQKEGVLNFCSNNYLGLCDNDLIAQEAKRVLDERGFGLSSVRFICGTTDYHKALEDRLSRFYETEDTILFPSCFDANEAIFEALLGEEDAVITDSLNHASIINGRSQQESVCPRPGDSSTATMTWTSSSRLWSIRKTRDFG